MLRHELIKVKTRKTPVRMAIFTESDVAIHGEVVNVEGNEITIRKPFAIHVTKEETWKDGFSWKSTTTIVPKTAIEWRKPLGFDLKYGTLELDRS